MKSIRSLIRALLQRGEQYRRCLQWSKARSAYKAALRFQLPAELAAKVHASLAEMELEIAKFEQARRHLQAALALAPRDAQLHFLMGQALEMDESKPVTASLTCYRKAVELAPDMARYRLALGRVLLAHGQPRSAMKQWWVGAELDPDDVACLEAYLEQLTYQASDDKVRQQLYRAAFGRHHLPAFQRIQQRIEFQLASRRQIQHHRIRLYRVEEEPAILSFPAMPRAAAAPSSDGTILRIDAPSLAKPHIPRKRKARFKTQS